jgi:hypothetical protein
MMKGMKKTPVPGSPDNFVFHGNTEVSHSTHTLYFGVDTAQGLMFLSNGFMRDDRVFHINQPNWIEMYNQQGEFCFIFACWDYTDRGTVHFEVTARKAWDSEGLEAVKELAQKRLKEKGWDDVRPALAVTVRYARTKSIVQDLLIPLQRMDNESCIRRRFTRTTSSRRRVLQTSSRPCRMGKNNLERRPQIQQRSHL